MWAFGDGEVGRWLPRCPLGGFGGRGQRGQHRGTRPHHIAAGDLSNTAWNRRVGSCWHSVPHAAKLEADQTARPV
jgi:hypothetical protein